MGLYARYGTLPRSVKSEINIYPSAGEVIGDAGAFPRVVWELIVEAGRDPVSGRRRQVSRVFHGNLREAKKARAELIVEASRGRHSGTRATMGDLFDAWIVELRRKGRSPNSIQG